MIKSLKKIDIPYEYLWMKTMSIWENANFQTAPAEAVAGWIAVDYLRQMNVMERPYFMALIKKWRKDVAKIIVKKYKHHAE